MAAIVSKLLRILINNQVLCLNSLILLKYSENKLEGEYSS